MNIIDTVHKALSQTIVPLVFTTSRWTGLSLPILQGRDLRLGNLLQASQDQDPGLLMLSGSEAFPSRDSCPKFGLVSLLLLSPSPASFPAMEAGWWSTDPHQPLPRGWSLTTACGLIQRVVQQALWSVSPGLKPLTSRLL